MLTIGRSRLEEGERVIEFRRSAVDATHAFLAPEDRLATDEMFVDGDIERAGNL
jgi:putative acetyltransferase